MKLKALLLALALFAFSVPAYSATQTINTLPDAGSSFLTDLQDFLEQEIPEHVRQRVGHVVLSGGQHAAAAGFTHTISALVAFPNGYYVSQDATSKTYTASKDTWVYVRDSDSRTVAIGGAAVTYDSHLVYAEMNNASTEPAVPTGCLPLMKVITDGSDVTTVTDLRGGEIPAEAFAGLATAVAAADNRTLVINGRHVLGANLTIGADVVVRIPEGGLIIHGSYDITANGTVQAGPYQIFSGSGSVDMTANKVQEKVYAEWWGATADGSTAGQEVFINRALTATSGIPVQLLDGTYITSNPIVIDDHDILVGLGPRVTIIQLANDVDDNAIETYEWDEFEADPAYGMLPIHFQIRDLCVDGNSDNNASGHGLALNGASYILDNLIIRKCQENGYYANATRTVGTTYPAVTHADYAPNCLVTRLKVNRCEGDNIDYGGPNDAHWDMITSVNSQTGYGLDLSANVDIGYLHAFANKKANMYATANFAVNILELRDGWAEALIVDHSGVFQIDQMYADNNDRDNGNKPIIDLDAGKGIFGSVYLASQGNAETFIDIDGSSGHKFGIVRINGNNGTGKAIDVGASAVRVWFDYVEVDNLTATTESILWAGDRGGIGHAELNDCGGIEITGDYNNVNSARLNVIADDTSAENFLVSGAGNVINGLVFRTILVDALKVTGNNNIIGAGYYTGITGEPVTISGNHNVLISGNGDVETITAAGAARREGLTSFDSTDGAMKVTLADGGNVDGIIKVAFLQTDGGDVEFEIANHEGANDVDVTFNDAGDMAVFMWVRTEWITIQSWGTI